MTEISVDARSDFAGVILACDPPFDLYLTLRDSDGKVLWSQGIYQICHATGRDSLSINTESISKKIDQATEVYRAGLQLKLRQAGML